jgi:hypothetical protein
LAMQDEYEALKIYSEDDEGNEEENVPDAVSVTESESSSDDESSEFQPLQMQPPLAVCRNDEDEKTVSLLPQFESNQTPSQDEFRLALLNLPYKLALMFFPCLC